MFPPISLIFYRRGFSHLWPVSNFIYLSHFRLERALQKTGRGVTCPKGGIYGLENESARDKCSMSV